MLQLQSTLTGPMEPFGGEAKTEALRAQLAAGLRVEADDVIALGRALLHRPPPAPPAQFDRAGLLHLIVELADAYAQQPSGLTRTQRNDLAALFVEASSPETVPALEPIYIDALAVFLASQLAPLTTLPLPERAHRHRQLVEATAQVALQALPASSRRKPLGEQQEAAQRLCREVFDFLGHTELANLIKKSKSSALKKEVLPTTEVSTVSPRSLLRQEPPRRFETLHRLRNPGLEIGTRFRNVAIVGLVAGVVFTIFGSGVLGTPAASSPDLVPSIAQPLADNAPTVIGFLGTVLAVLVAMLIPLVITADGSWESRKSREVRLTLTAAGQIAALSAWVITVPTLIAVGVDPRGQLLPKLLLGCLLVLLTTLIQILTVSLPTIGHADLYVPIRLNHLAMTENRRLRPRGSDRPELPLGETLLWCAAFLVLLVWPIVLGLTALWGTVTPRSLLLLFALGVVPCLGTFLLARSAAVAAAAGTKDHYLYLALGVTGWVLCVPVPLLFSDLHPAYVVLGSTWAVLHIIVLFWRPRVLWRIAINHERRRLSKRA